MDPRLVQIFGPRFLVDDVRDLELLTDLLALSKDHLNVVFAVASYLEQVPNGSRQFKPLLKERLQDSIEHLRARDEKPGLIPVSTPPSQYPGPIRSVEGAGRAPGRPH